jgi:2'-5' RNA ligase
VRVFLGSVFGPDHQAYYWKFASALARGFPHALRPVPEGSVHLTYVFVGDAAEESLAAMADAARTIGAAHPPFAITLGAPQVRWIGRVPRLIEAPVLGGAGETRALASALTESLRATDPGLDLDPLKAPHATLARFRKRATRSDARTVASAMHAEPRHATVDRVSIIVSRLTPAGPIYDIRGEVGLG